MNKIVLALSATAHAPNYTRIYWFAEFSQLESLEEERERNT